MEIKVHGNIFSVPSLRVFACLAEKGLQSEYIHVNMVAGDHKKETYLSLNPFGLVPAFEDGNLKLFESRAINQYIAHTYKDRGNQLICQDPEKMALVYVWMEVEAQIFEPAASKLVWELKIKPMLGMITDDAVVEEYEGKLGKVLDVYEAQLMKSKYLAGECFTLADLNHIPSVNYLMGSRVRKVFDACPHVVAWCDNIMARTAWIKVIAMQKKH